MRSTCILPLSRLSSQVLFLLSLQRVFPSLILVFWYISQIDPNDRDSSKDCYFRLLPLLLLQKEPQDKAGGPGKVIIKRMHFVGSCSSFCLELLNRILFLWKSVRVFPLTSVGPECDPIFVKLKQIENKRLQIN